MNRWRRFRRLPARERALVVAALGALPLAAASLRLLGFERTRGLFERLTRFPLARVRRPEAIAPRSSVTARMVGLAASHSRFGATCLPRSLVLASALRLQGIEAVLRVGVRTENETLAAHAWVEVDGRSLDERGDAVREEFSPFSRSFGPPKRDATRARIR